MNIPKKKCLRDLNTISKREETTWDSDITVDLKGRDVRL
jgi:hypothetical protein